MRANGDLGYDWLKTNSAGSGPFVLKSWKAERDRGARSQSRTTATARRRSSASSSAMCPKPAAQRLMLEKGDIDMARNLTADQIQGIAGNADLVVEAYPKADLYYLGLNQKDERLAKPEGAQGAALAGRLSGHGGHLPQGPLQGPPVLLAVGLLCLAHRHAVQARRRQGEGAAGRSRLSRRLRGRARRLQQLALVGHRAVDPGDHGPGRHQGQASSPASRSR